MNNLQKLKSLKGNSPFQVPLKVLVVATSRYRKNEQDRSCTEVGVADSSAAMKMLVYDENKLTIIKEHATVLLRNIIVRDGQLIVTSATKLNTSCGVTPPECIKTEAKGLVVLPPAPEVTLAEARQTGFDTLVSLKGKIIKEEALAYRDMSRTGEVRVPVKNITLQDLTGETKIGLWRNLSSSVINVGQNVMVTECKINKFRGDTSFNSTSKSVLLAHVEVLRVMVDGHYMENEDQILVCCIKNTDTYMDYVIEEDVLRTITEDGEITELDFPAEALVSVQKVNNKDVIKSTSIL